MYAKLMLVAAGCGAIVVFTPFGVLGDLRATELVSPVAVPFASGPAFPQGRAGGNPPDPEYAADRAIDGDPATFCCLLDDTLGGPSATTLPANAAAPVTGHMIFDLGRPVPVCGARLTARVPGGPYNPKEVDFFCFADDDSGNHPTLGERLESLRREALVDATPLMPRKLLFVKRYTYSPGWYYAEFMRASRFGGNLCVLSVDDGKVTELVPELAGGIFDRYDLSFDARRVVFGSKAAPGKGFRIYEVGVDGHGLRQLCPRSQAPPGNALTRGSASLGQARPGTTSQITTHRGRTIMRVRLFQSQFRHAAVIFIALLAASRVLPAAEPPPNFILIVCDNLGYGDVGCYGSKLHRTPHIDRMAAEGMRFTDFYVTSGVCTPSRASLMTGCYPRRVSMHVDEDGRQVLPAVSHKGLHPNEITIAEVLQGRGYATAIVGKWHLGDQLPFLPTRQGFGYWLGIPYSDNMTAHPRRPTWPPLPLMENERVIEAPPDRNLLTKRYTEKVIEFVTENRDRPFFVYLSQAMPGSTRAPFASEAFRGKSANGPWGDSVEELDWSTGEILAAVKRLGLDERTLVIWTNDNGAPRRNPPQGSNLPLAGWGYTTAEGGMRVPCVMRWPGKIPAGATCGELCTTMDFLPTFARLAGTEPPQDRILDGHDVRPLISGQPGAKSPYEAFYYYYLEQLQAVRSGKWKLYLPLENKWRSFRGDTEPCPAELYDLVADLGETTNLVDKHPDVVQRLLGLAEKARQDLGDLGRPGKNQRPAALVENPTPRVMDR